MGSTDSDNEALPNRPLAGSLQMLGSTLAFAGVGALAKLAMTSLETEMVVFFRNFMALVIMMPWLLIRLLFWQMNPRPIWTPGWGKNSCTTWQTSRAGERQSS